MTNLKSILFDPSNLSSFGVLETAELTPIIQGDFVHGLNTQIWQTSMVTGTGAVIDTDAARLRVQVGTSATGYAYILSRQPIRYRAGQGVTLRYTPIFAVGVEGNVQFQGMGTVVSNALYDGYFMGYSGTAFGIGHYIRGTLSWVAQSNWNGDKCDGLAGSSFAYDPTKGTPIMIKYPYLGYGDIRFFIQNPTTGRWRLCHTIRYANTVATTQLSNPSLHLASYIKNIGNTSNKIMYMGSYGAFISGPRLFVGSPKWAMDNNKSGITTETNIISIRNATNYNGVPNRGMIRVNGISIGSSAGAGIAVFRLKIGATVSGTPSFAAINGSTANNGVSITGGNSIASYDVAGTTISGGNYVYSISVDNPNSRDLDLIPFNIFIAPGETLTISGFSSQSSQLGVSVNWTEDI